VLPEDQYPENARQGGFSSSGVFAVLSFLALVLGSTACKWCFTTLKQRPDGGNSVKGIAAAVTVFAAVGVSSRAQCILTPEPCMNFDSGIDGMRRVQPSFGFLGKVQGQMQRQAHREACT
jgi:hypothetical protein